MFWQGLILWYDNYGLWPWQAKPRPKTTEANLTKFHRKIEHDEKVCRAQELGYYAQGQGHNHVRGQIALKIRSE